MASLPDSTTTETKYITDITDADTDTPLHAAGSTEVTHTHNDPESRDIHRTGIALK